MVENLPLATLKQRVARVLHPLHMPTEGFFFINDCLTKHLFFLFYFMKFFLSCKSQSFLTCIMLIVLCVNIWKNSISLLKKKFIKVIRVHYRKLRKYMRGESPIILPSFKSLLAF